MGALQKSRRVAPWPFGNDLEKVFEGFLGGHPLAEAWKSDKFALTPPLNVLDQGGNLLVEVELPGIKDEDVHLEYENGVLAIKGEHKEEKKEEKDGYLHQERVTGSFYRSVRLPADIDEAKISAALENGVLKVTLPKAEAAKPQRIKINGK